jgi:ectoine hydroxylase-related dioxygenase (phytanoyl-CoA dioxygenase family)
MSLKAKLTLPNNGNSTTQADVDAVEALHQDGYCVLRRLMPHDSINQMNRDLDRTFQNTPCSEGLFYGNWTRRFGGLLKRSDVAKTLAMHPIILSLVESILNPHCESIQLSLMQAIEVSPDAPAQVPHRDQDSWGGEKGKMEYMVSVMWPLTPFRRQNGATVVWPGSNHINPSIEEMLTGGIPAEMDPGDALIFLGSTMHAQGANRTSLARRGLVISYCLGWLKPHENQWLVYPPEIARTFSPELAALVGYRRHKPNLNNYEGQCPSILLKDILPDYIPSMDEFPDHLNQMINAFRHIQAQRAQSVTVDERQ